VTLSSWLELLKSIFQFPNALLQFAKLLQKTPTEKHEALLAKIAAEAKVFEDTGRPTW
jgi:hypothetical protein